IRTLKSEAIIRPTPRVRRVSRLVIVPSRSGVGEGVDPLNALGHGRVVWKRDRKDAGETSLVLLEAALLEHSFVKNMEDQRVVAQLAAKCSGKQAHRRYQGHASSTVLLADCEMVRRIEWSDPPSQ